MPIDASRLEDDPVGLLNVKEGSQPHRVLQFLARNEESAFTQSEIAEATGIKRGSVGAALSRLDGRGFLRHGGRYWAISRDDQLISALIEGQAVPSDAHRRAAESFAERVSRDLGEHVDRVLLFGSVAREETRSRASDVDLLVVLASGAERTTVEENLRELAYDVELEEGVALSLVVKMLGDFKRESDQPFLRAVMADAERLYQEG